ncbi:helix-turn-helix transcriptional regulator [Paenibacillus sp. 1001270B_150601_E10]|uniref:helix-turn-helix transcriptional regulator n=1 Tax=Paenibacillus sp. 1001270B_150601_E10 TaxID=2787079 RepID=UPI001E36429B|nr:AraC family transcriptional regulator [Paenibacillus sp. 1001270B_150601_E10]
MVLIDVKQLSSQLAASQLQLHDIHYKVLDGHCKDKSPPIMSQSIPFFLFPVRGSGEVMIDHTMYSLSTSFIIHGNGAQRVRFQSSPEPVHYYLLRYEMHACSTKGESSEDRLLPHCEIQVRERGSIDHLLHRLLHLTRHAGEQEELKVRALFYSLLAEMIDCARVIHHSSDAKLVEDAVLYIHHHYMEPLKLHDIASRYDKTDKHFSYVFHKELGISPMNYLIQHRLKEAERLLQQPYSTVREAARMVGYSDPYFFSKLYKKHKGVSPNQVKGVSSETTRSSCIGQKDPYS